MPEKQTLARARADQRQGKAASTQAGEFIQEEFDHTTKACTAHDPQSRP